MRQGLTPLQQFDGDIVGRAYKGHTPVARWAIDCHTVVGQVLTHFVDIADLVGEMAEMPAVRRQPVISVPVPGQFQRAIVIPVRRQVNQGEAARLAFVAADFLEPQKGVEGHGFFKIGHADHGVQVFHVHVGFPW